MVLQVGLEPTRLSTLVPKTSLATVTALKQILILSFGQVSFYELITVSFVVKTGFEPVFNVHSNLIIASFTMLYLMVKVLGANP